MCCSFLFFTQFSRTVQSEESLQMHFPCSCVCVCVCVCVFVHGCMCMCVCVFFFFVLSRQNASSTMSTDLLSKVARSHSHRLRALSRLIHLIHGMSSSKRCCYNGSWWTRLVGNHQTPSPCPFLFQTNSSRSNRHQTNQTSSLSYLHHHIWQRWRKMNR